MTRERDPFENKIQRSTVKGAMEDNSSFDLFFLHNALSYGMYAELQTPAGSPFALVLLHGSRYSVTATNWRHHKRTVSATFQDRTQFP